MRLVDADQFDELVAIVDALADVVKSLAIDSRHGVAAESAAQRARLLRQQRMGEDR